MLRSSNVLPFNWNTKGGFRCFYCSKTTKDCHSLKEHTLKHSTINLEDFVNKHIITKDVPIKVDTTNLACKVCTIPFVNFDDLLEHIAGNHSEEYDASAGVCFFPFLLNKELMQCVLCDSNYDNFASMIAHMYKQHVSHSYMCQICGLSFKDQNRLKKHITRSHIGNRCTICKKTFDALHKLVKHKQRFHGQIKLHECSLCSEKFLNSYQVKVHMGKVHNVEKYLIKCGQCPKVCTTKGAMLLHVQSLHSEVRYQCNLCDYTAGIKWLIKLHKRKHFGLKEYSCSICERNFGRSSNLRAHMKVHTGKAGRVCRVCRKGFADFQSIEKHELEVHYYDHF